ncbi:MAG TPA: hypothetical protein VGU71_15675 [Candidatus Dormibacteraeota bacterium]|nr:hypothetical protein [Candidatus Dormibacteraeota bacterium]
MDPSATTKLSLGALVLAGLLTVAACDSTTTSQTPAPAAGGDATTGESAPVSYTDARYHYVIDAPGRMNANADGTASFIGPSERLEIAVVTGSSASDPAALAAKDSTSLAVSASGFHQLSNPATVTLSGHHVTKFSYTWNAGVSGVTGKPIELTAVRYYVPKDSATVAVITYGIVSNQFDPQGADDLASTFKWQ